MFRFIYALSPASKACSCSANDLFQAISYAGRGGCKLPRANVTDTVCIALKLNIVSTIEMKEAV